MATAAEIINDDGYLRDLAASVLESCKTVSDRARERLGAGKPPTSASLGVNHTGIAHKAMQHLSEINTTTRIELDRLVTDPLIARLVVEGEDGRKKVLFICENGQASSFLPGLDVASYRSPKGRLASLAVGDDGEVALPGGRQSFIVLEKSRFRAREQSGGWDALDAAVARAGSSPVTIRSMRALIAHTAPSGDLSVLDRLLQDERASAVVVRGLQRSAVQRMALRAQPILDQFQDDVFRLPLDSQIILMGPPGSGKTTTLIKRLGLKLDLRSLAEYEEDYDLVEGSAAGLEGHHQSWLMFTPTELLKQYVKEAFNREGVPASELRMKTWSDYRRSVARTTFGILKTSNAAGAILRDELPSLLPDTQKSTIAWYEDFSRWQFAQFSRDLSAAATAISNASSLETARLGQRLANEIDRAAERVGPTLFLEIGRMADEIERQASAIGASVRGQLDGFIATEVRRSEDLLDNLAHHLEELANENLDDSDDGADAEEEEDPVSESVQKGRREQALDAYRRALAAEARAMHSRKQVGAATRNGRILSWLGSRRPEAADLAKLGASLQLLTAIRRFRNPLRAYFSGLRTRYRRFRNARREEGVWYAASGYAPSDIGPLELDIVLLTFLSDARTLLSNATLARRAREGQIFVLSSVLALRSNQVVVDEATDFSPVQLACMFALVEPNVRGFLACGDFNQRMTGWGARNLEELKWVLPGLDVRPITITYRHSRQLNDLSRAIARLSGDTSTAATLPDHMDNEGVAPALGLGLEGQPRIAWIAQRIREVERIAGKLPTIAVLVVAEPDVEPVARALDEQLHGNNIKAVACQNGQVVGLDNDVRVFAVEHIKGLEFEAVFFVDLDQLAAHEPDLFEKRLYVGATRAAMFLGITCRRPALPSSIQSLAHIFIENWAQPVGNREI